MELLLPADYVPQDRERIALYQELDGINRELDLRAFADRLRDRFGKIPPEAAELLRVPRLRRLARRLGIEKVALKQGKMFLYFVGEQNLAYYQSPMFGRIIDYVSDNPARCRFRQGESKRSIVISDVPTVETATGVLASILEP